MEKEERNKNDPRGAESEHKKVAGSVIGKGEARQRAEEEGAQSKGRQREGGRCAPMTRPIQSRCDCVSQSLTWLLS